MTAAAQDVEALADEVTPASSPSTGRAGEMVLTGAARVAATLTDGGGPGDRGGWLAVVGTCQSLINTLTAVQHTALAQAARRESVWCEDGTLGETVHAPGRVTLDAADLAAPLLGASHSQAQRRVELAVRLAADRAPVPAEHRDLPEASGLSGLHAAMAQGRLDAFRAGVVAFELEIAPADVADAVVTALDPHLGDDAAKLRQRARVLLSRISPDLVRERATRARAATGLRRWVGEPGVDEWHGTFPSEDAACAWAAIDKLAHELVADGTCSNVEQARGKALTDLVTGNATIDVQVVLTVPADATSPQATPSPNDAAPRSDVARSDGAAPPCDLAGSVTNQRHTITPAPDDTESAIRDHGLNEGKHEEGDHVMTSANGIVEVFRQQGDHAASPTTSIVEAPRENGDHAASASVGIEEEQSHDIHRLARPAQDARHEPATCAVHGGPIGCGEDLIEVQGARPSEPLLVRRAWLRDHLTAQPPRPKRGRRKPPAVFVPCDPLTGARLDPHDHLTTDAYRPGAELTALVKARDGRCRFPGCSVAARFCDLDHVRPWPTGRTAARNLLTLCRRHHRIKQRPGWQLRLASDGTATWTDPAGRVRTTAPLDTLQSLVLAPESAEPAPGTAATATTTATGQATSSWSVLETFLELRVEHTQAVSHDWFGGSTHRRCTSAADLRAGIHRRRAPRSYPDLPPF